MPNPNFLCGTAPAFFQASKWSMVIFSIRSELCFPQRVHPILMQRFRSTCLLEKSRSILLKLSAIFKLHLHFSAASYYCKSAYQLTHSIRNITFGTETTRSSIYTSVQDDNNNNNNMPERPALYIAVMSRPLISVFENTWSHSTDYPNLIPES